MSTKKLQIIDFDIKQAENADMLDGKHADEFASVSDVEELHSEVVDDINSATTELTAKIDEKADSSHKHTIADISDLNKGSPNGVAELDSTGKIPTSQLPSFVDDVIEGYLSGEKFYEDSAYTTEIIGEPGKIYLDISSNKTYRWSGTTFVVISETIALGETSSTAYRGDRGKIAYNHSQLTNGNPHGVTKFDVGLGNVENKSSSTIRSELTKENVTDALGYTPPETDTTYTSLKNPYALTIQGNGTTLTNGTYDGSAAKTVNITPSSIGAAAASHGTHVTYSTTVPLVAGTAAVGTASTVSKSDHVHPAQTSVSGNAGTATKWATTRNINGLSVDGTANRVNYGTCSTAAATAAKVVACTGFALVTGAEITVKFTVTNTAASPTLNVNSTGAKAIYYRGAAISAGYLAANRTYTFRYNGTQYELVGDINTDTNTKVTQTVTTTNASYPLLLAPSGQTATTTTTSYFDSGVTLNPSTNTIAANVSGSSASCTGNAATATKLATARTLTIGNTGKSFNGSANAAWTLAEIGAATKPVVLFTSDTGDNTSETITLTDDVSNYSRIEIIYGLSWNTTNVAVCIPALSKRVALSVSYGASSDSLSTTVGMCKLEGTSLYRGTLCDTINRERRILIDYNTSETINITRTMYTASTGFGIYIYRVIGYKD